MRQLAAAFVPASLLTGFRMRIECSSRSGIRVEWPPASWLERKRQQAAALKSFAGLPRGKSDSPATMTIGASITQLVMRHAGSNLCGQILEPGHSLGKVGCAERERPQHNAVCACLP